MKRKLHFLAAIVATLSIATFFTSTVLVELFASHETIARVKSLIVMPGLLILIPALALTSGTGFACAIRRKGKLVEDKKKRMPFIAANGVLILVPAAIFLDNWASQGAFNTNFYIVQFFELLAGAINLFLMSLNMRDGLKMSGKLKTNKNTQSES